MEKEDHQDQLRIINDSVNHLLDEDLDVEISRKLEESGFERIEDNSLRYSKDGVEIIYRGDGEKPFSIISNDGKTVEVKRVLSNLLKNVIEDI